MTEFAEIKCYGALPGVTPDDNKPADVVILVDETGRRTVVCPWRRMLGSTGGSFCDYNQSLSIRSLPVITNQICSLQPSEKDRAPECITSQGVDQVPKCRICLQLI